MERQIPYRFGAPVDRPWSCDREAELGVVRADDAVEVANANAVTTALRVLDNRELVARRARTWHVAGPFLRRWIVEQSSRS